MTSYDSIDNTMRELQQSRKIQGYPVENVMLNGQKHNGLVYWFHETETLGLWIFGTHIFERHVTDDERSKFIRAPIGPELENKWNNAFTDLTRKLIKIKEVKDKIATLTYLVGKLTLERVDDIPTISQRYQRILSAFTTEVIAHSRILAGIRKEQNPPKKRVLEKPGTNLQSGYNRNRRVRPQVKRGADGL